MDSILVRNLTDFFSGPSTENFPTIKTKFRESGQNTAGFDYLRLILSASVIVTHSFRVCYGQEAIRDGYGGKYHFVIALILPMFFALSGFLVAGSLDRTRNVIQFAFFRAFRLLPALFAEILFSAIIVGPLITQCDLHEYFGSRLFREYFLNIIGIVKFELPCVFTNNLQPHTVNQSLWTLPFELECYVLLIALWSLKLFSRPRLLTSIIIISAFAGTAYLFYKNQPELQFQPPTGRSLIIAFLAGVAIYCWSDKITINPRYIILSSIVSIPLLQCAETIYLATLPVSYLTICLGLIKLKKIKFFFNGDYSYGIYLFGFPVQQILSQYSAATRVWWINSALSIVICFFIAKFSWKFIEKPALDRKYLVIKIIKYIQKPR